MTERSSTDTARFEEIKSNIALVRARMEQAAARAGRDPAGIKLMAVTKFMPASDASAAAECGADLIGENRVQELCRKLPEIDLRGREVHLIGHLQTNKVRPVIGKVDMIQSVGSIHLAREIDKQARAAGVIMNVLAEVNIGGEQSKSGVPPEELGGLIAEMAEMRALRVLGLMTIPPDCGSAQAVRPYFAKMHKLFVDIRSKKTDNIDMQVLSMGMSGDFETAIEEGSTMVRVGTAIFGKRQI
jgi:pyridoxal phosphate enzyme (YggS family)